MSILDKLLSRLGYMKAANIANPPDWLSATAEAHRWSVPDMSLYENQAELYQRLSWVFTAVSITSSYAATTALNIKRRRGETERDIDNHDFELLLRRPNPLMSRFEFLRATYAYSLLCGNSYWWLNRMDEKSQPSEIWVIPPSRIRPQPDGKMYVSNYWYDPGDGREMSIPTWQVVHFREFHPNSQFMGLSRVEPVATDSAADLEQSKWMGKLYGENNGRLPGIIAFSDPINNTDWQIIKKDIQDAAAKRSFLLLRNAGKGGVEWLQAVATVKDMEMLAGRTFTKEEIYSVFAPGLSSILAINATEANARTGKGTLIEFGIWPLLVAVSEKITNDLLPVYESAQISLVAEFDDIRITDRAMELQEQAEFSKTHTIDEIRKQYYEDKPLAQATGIEGDERGVMLPAQVSSGTPVPGEEPPPAPLLPTPPQSPQPAPGEEMGASAQEMQRQAETVEEYSSTAIRAEFALWERKAIKALSNGKPAAIYFKSDVIPPAEQARISNALKQCKNEHEIKAVFALPAKAEAPDLLTDFTAELKRLNDNYERALAA